MKESGLFRTKLFGGFNKKDVFEYFDVLKSQIKEENAELIEKSNLNVEELEQSKNTIIELENKVKELENKLSELENANNQLSGELSEKQEESQKITELENQNSSLSQELFKVNTKLVEENKYKTHCDELTRKVIKAESELLIKDAKIKKLQENYDDLLNKITQLPKIDDDLMVKAKDSITSLAHILGSVNLLIESVGGLKDEENK